LRLPPLHAPRRGNLRAPRSHRLRARPGPGRDGRPRPTGGAVPRGGDIPPRSGGWLPPGADPRAGRPHILDAPMRIGIVAHWFNRGQGVVARHLRSALDELGHDTFVLARPTRATNRRPAFVDRG